MLVFTKTHILGAEWKTAPVCSLKLAVCCGQLAASKKRIKQNGPIGVYYKHFSLSKSSKPIAPESQADRYGTCMLLTHACVYKSS